MVHRPLHPSAACRRPLPVAAQALPPMTASQVLVHTRLS